MFFGIGCKKMWDEKFFWKKFHPTPCNMIFFFFYKILNEIGAFKRIKHFVQHRKFRMMDALMQI